MLNHRIRTRATERLIQPPNQLRGGTAPLPAPEGPRRQAKRSRGTATSKSQGNIRSFEEYAVLAFLTTGKRSIARRAERHTAEQTRQGPRYRPLRHRPARGKPALVARPGQNQPLDVNPPVHRLQEEQLGVQERRTIVDERLASNYDLLRLTRHLASGCPGETGDHEKRKTAHHPSLSERRRTHYTGTHVSLIPLGSRPPDKERSVA